jgi:heme exporter protein D
MQFASFSDFLAMGGYGFFVWLSFGSCALILLGILMSSWFEGKSLKQAIRSQMAREERIKQAKEEQLS